MLLVSGPLPRLLAWFVTSRPAFTVKPSLMAPAAIELVRLQVPAPVLMNPVALAVVTLVIVWAVMLRAEPAPTSTIATVEPVFSVPTPVRVTVELPETVMPFTVMVAPVIELFAVNAAVPLAHAALKGPEADVPYTAVLSVPLVCVVFQYCCAMASDHCAQIRPAQIAAMTNAWVALRLD